MERKKYIDGILERLTFLVSKVELNNSLNLTDINIISENFFRDLLNRIYKFNLKNLNSVTPNVQGIDLIDEVNRIAFQITSNKKIGKIKDTIKSFIQKELNKEYPRLIIFIITKRKSQNSKKTIEESGFTLNLKEDVWDMCKLLHDINDKELEEIRDIHRFLNEQITFPLSEEKNLSTTGNNLNNLKQKYKKSITMKKKVIKLFDKLRYRDNLIPVPHTEVELDSQKVVIRSTVGDDYPTFSSQGDIHRAEVIAFVGYYDIGQDCGIEVVVSPCLEEAFVEKNTGRWFLDNPIIKTKIPEWKDWQRRLVFQCAKLSYNSIELIDKEIDNYQYGPRFFCTYKNTNPPFVTDSVRYIPITV